MVHINSCILLAYLQFKPICQWFNSLILITVLPSDITSSRWVGGGQVAAPGSVKVAASVLFPAAPKHLTLSFSLNLGVFEWPMNGSNMSGYLSVPRDLAVVVYRKLEDGQEAPISWEDAQAEGVGEFAVRGVVAPCSSEEVFFQLAAVPFSIDHMLTNYAAVYDEPFFPCTMLKVVRTPTKMLPGSKVATSTLVKRVKLVVKDVEGFGLGMIPFFSAMRFNPAVDPVYMPEVGVIKKALGEFMAKGRLPVVKSAANLPDALVVALEGDKNPVNVLPGLRTPWTVLLEQVRGLGGSGAVLHGGGGGVLLDVLPGAGGAPAQSMLSSDMALT